MNAMQQPYYQHRQTGPVVIAITSLMAVLFALLAFYIELVRVPMALVALLMVALTVIFGSLTVTVDATTMKARFGLGLFGKRAELSQVRHYAAVKNKWWYGLGIKMYPGGWLYNVGGLDAVEFTLNDGKRFRIGTDEPELLVEALRVATGDKAPLTSAELAVAKRSGRKLMVILAVVVVAICSAVGGLFYLEARPATMTLTSTSLTVESFIYGETYALEDITAVTLERTLPRVQLRTNGTGLGATLRGHFRLEGLGDGYLFIEADKPPFIKVLRGDDYLFFNVADAAKTRAMFDQLNAAWQAVR